MANGATGSRTYRLVTAAFGLLFVVIAVAIVLLSDRTFGPVLAATVIGILGIEAMASAFRNKPSLLSRLGPLP
jgi:hypothetical protein